MSDFILVTYEKPKQPGSSIRDFFNTIHRKLSNFINNINFADLVKIIDIYNNVRCYAITLPCNKKGYFTIDLRKFKRFLCEFMSEKGVKSCVLPKALKDNMGIENCLPNEHCSTLVFKCLINRIIAQVSQNADNSSYDREICIIHGKDEAELFELIKFLSTTAKYITVLSNSKEPLDKGIDEIYDEYGLSIAVTDECKSVLRDSEIVINLGDLNEMSNNQAIIRNALIINFGTIDVQKISSNCKVINGINTKLPVQIKNKFNKAVFNCYTESQIAEILLYQRAGGGYEDIETMNESKLLEIMEHIFSADGLTIVNFKGVHGAVSL